MRRREFLRAAGTAGLFAASGTGLVAATPARSPGPKEEELLVGVSASAPSPAAVVESVAPPEAEVVHENRTLHYAAVRFAADAPEGARENFAAAVERREEVKYAEPNETLEALYEPNDAYYGRQYAPQMVNADAAWDVTLGDAGVSVAVVDTGVQYDHEDLAGNFADDPGYDFADGDADPYPDSPSDEYHGTHVAGIAGAVTDNAAGIAGVSDSTLFNGRALDETGRGSTSDVADAVQWAADRGADVVNLSLGSDGYSSTMKNAVSYAYDAGSLLVAAAGNDGTNSVSYPAAYAECLAVSALDEDGSLASYSNYGDEIELAAPGTGVASTTTDARGSYERLSGTSMATPVVAGCAGLALARWELTNVELRDHLKATAVDAGLPESQQGSGRVDAGEAVSTDPAGDGGGGSTSASVADSLSYSGDEDCWYYSWEYADPSKVVVELDGPNGADFDLYVNEGRARCPTTGDYDYRSVSPDSRETIEIDYPDASTDLYAFVYSYSGSGEYALTVTEYQ